MSDDSHERPKYDPYAFWEARHASYKSDFRNVGNKTISSEQNKELLVAKAVHLAYVLGSLGVPRTSWLLDAGCGQGFLTTMLDELGYRCHGVDVSNYAISNGMGRERISYHSAPLETFRIEQRFDVILCADVLYHVVDDQKWEQVLGNFVAHLSEGGRLVIVECFSDSESIAEHCRWRTLGNYQAFAEKSRLELSCVSEFREPYTHDTKSVLLMMNNDFGA